MASPEVLESSGTLDSSLQEELSAPVGWKKKLMPRKTGTPKRKDVVYVAPDGEEIRNKRQLDKYLKNHSGGPSAADFDWSTGETPRRSARLSTKGRLSSDSMEAEPGSKRSKVSSDDEASIVVSPKKPSRRKSGPQTPTVAKDEIMEDAEKAEDDGTTTGDGVAVGSAVAPAEEKVALTCTETVDNNADEKNVAVEIGAVKIGESAEQLPATEPTVVGNSTDKVNAEEKPSKTEETVFVADAVMDDAPVVEEVTVILEQPAATSDDDLAATFKTIKAALEGETSLKDVQEEKEVESQDTVDVPASGKLDGKGDDLFKPKEHSESHGIHALIAEPVVSGVTKSPEQSEPPLPAAERGRRGCSRSKSRGSRNPEEIHGIPEKFSRGNGSSSYKVTHGPWDPTDSSHLLAVKTALHLSAVPDTVLCRESEQANVMNFCKACIMMQQPGSIYICGCPGTGKSLTIEKVKLLCAGWSKEVGTLHPETVVINCTSLTEPRHIYLRVLQALNPGPVIDESTKDNDMPMRELKRLICNLKSSKSARRMLLLIVDEMDYLITRDQSVLYELFRFPTYANSRLVLIGIANSIDLTDRLLPKLRSMNCKVDVITFPTYTKEQVLSVLQQRLLGLPYSVFHPAALELCARKVAAATGDMRKALHVCRTAVELVQADANTGLEDENKTPVELHFGGEGRHSSAFKADPVELPLVRIDTMVKALSSIFRSPVVETIQALPRHQQMVLCASVRCFRRGKKDSNLGELNTGYLEFCKSTGMQALGAPEFSSVCQVLADQEATKFLVKFPSANTVKQDRKFDSCHSYFADHPSKHRSQGLFSEYLKKKLTRALLSLGKNREDRLRRITLKVDEEDIIFALQGIRFFRDCLQ